MYNMRFDITFALKTLLAPDNNAIQLTGIKDGVSSSAALKQEVERAMLSPQGRARLALAAAMGQIQGWQAGIAEPPAANDLDAQLKAIAVTEAGELVLREQVEQAAGGVFSWNVGVDYRAIFNQAGPSAVAMTKELYKRAGLDLDKDIDALNAAPRPRRMPPLWHGRAIMEHQREAEDPTLVLYTAVDPRASLSEFRRINRIVIAPDTGIASPGRSLPLRSLFFLVLRTCRCDYRHERANRTRRWRDTTVTAMNARAKALNAGQGGALGEPRFADFPDTPQFTRTFGADDPLPAGSLKPLASATASQQREPPKPE